MSDSDGFISLIRAKASAQEGATTKLKKLSKQQNKLQKELREWEEIIAMKKEMDEALAEARKNALPGDVRFKDYTVDEKGSGMLKDIDFKEKEHDAT